MENPDINAAQIGKMFVTSVRFEYKSGGKEWNYDLKKEIENPSKWIITANLANKPNGYHDQSMTIEVTQEIGQQLAEILIPIVIQDASKKAQQLADDSKAMLAALGDRTIKCITNMPTNE
jgi:hypothetical protein